MNIAIFAFNRPGLLQRTLTALAASDLADKASVIFFCDGPRHEKDEPGTRAVRELAKKAQGFAAVEVVERPQNMGCAASVIDGLTEMFRLHERLIVIEDDILTSPYAALSLRRFGPLCGQRKSLQYRCLDATEHCPEFTCELSLRCLRYPALQLLGLGIMARPLPRYRLERQGLSDIQKFSAAEQGLQCWW